MPISGFILKTVYAIYPFSGSLARRQKQKNYVLFCKKSPVQNLIRHIVQAIHKVF